MDIRLDKNNPIPIGVQVKEQIKVLINSGTYKQGDKLPSINQLATFLGVNKNTIVTVLKDLENDGYIYSHRGKGIFVSFGQKARAIGNDFVVKVDSLIKEALNRDINVNELINLISARFVNVPKGKKVKALFIIGIGRELIDVNLKKLRENIPEVDFEGLFLTTDLTKEKAEDAFEQVDLLIIPSIVYDYFKNWLPKDKAIIKTMANVKLLSKLKKGVEKKSKIAVIGLTQRGSRILADMFVSAKLFKPKLVIGIENLEENKKQLKEIDTLVVCESSKAEVEKLKLKDKEVYYFSDYLDDESMQEIKRFIGVLA